MARRVVIENILERYLIDRKLVLKEGNCISAPEYIQAGVPQGSILGPFLYYILYNIYFRYANKRVSTFADDTAILGVHENPQEASKLLQHILDFEKWLKQVNEQK